jgi:hypothetical protein
MKLLKEISIFVVGAAIGVAGSYKFFETKFANIADEEIESIKKMARDNVAKAQHQYDGRTIGTGSTTSTNDLEAREAIETEPIDIEEYVETPEEKEEAHKVYNDISNGYKAKIAEGFSNKTVKQKVDYAAISKVENADKVIVEESEEEDDDENEEQGQIPNYKRILPTQPIVISAEAYVEECLDYDKLTFHYYSKDGVLTDDNDDPFPDFEDYIGHDTVNKFGAFGVGDNLVYARNDKYESDYEIVKLDEFYV